MCPHAAWNECLNFRFDGVSVLEVYVDNYVPLVVLASKEELRHVPHAIMHGIHDVYVTNECDGEDPLSTKKLLKMEAMWAVDKDILGSMFDWVEKTMWLGDDKRKAILAVPKSWIGGAVRGNGIPFVEFYLIISKTQHTFLSVLAGNALVLPCNAILCLQPPVVYLERNKLLLKVVKDGRTLLQECTTSPAKYTQLV